MNRSPPRDFTDWLGYKKQKDISFITPALVRQWRDTLAPKTVNNALRVLELALGDVYRSEQIASNPVDKVRSLKQDTVDRKPFTMDEL